MQVQNLLQLFNLPQIGYSATSKDLRNVRDFMFGLIDLIWGGGEGVLIRVYVHYNNFQVTFSLNKLLISSNCKQLIIHVFIKSKAYSNL